MKVIRHLILPGYEALTFSCSCGKILGPFDTDIPEGNKLIIECSCGEKKEIKIERD